MQPPTDNLYKFLAIFGVLIVAFSIYVPLLRYIDLNRLSVRSDAIYGPMADPLRVLAKEATAELECVIYQDYLRDRQKPPMLNPCPTVSGAKSKGDIARPEVARLKAQVAPIEVERKSVWQEYVLFLYIGIAGFVVGVLMCIAGFWLWYDRLQRYLDAAVKADALSSGRVTARVPERLDDA